MTVLRGARGIGLALAVLAWPTSGSWAQESATGAGAAPAEADALVREIRRLEVLQRLDATRAAVRQDLEGDVAERGLSPDEVGRRIAEEFGVDVLEVTRAETEEGREAYAVRVMNPPGNYNAAFAVSVLLVDPSSGELLAQRSPHGHFEPGTPRLQTEGPEIRRRTYR